MTLGPNERGKPGPHEPRGVDAESRRALRRFISARLQNAEDADDVAQDAYVRYLSSGAEIRKPLSFLFKIAENLLCEYRHRKHRERQFVDFERETESVAELDASPEEALSRIDLLNRVLMQVPEGYRKVLILHKRDQLTAKQIAERLGLSERTVEHYVARALTYARNARWK